MRGGEVWKWIPGYENHYSVSNLGRVWNARKKFFPSISRNSKMYEVVGLLGKPKRVHTLVMAAFVGPRPIGYHICHKYGNASDNRVWNLRYDTAKGNIADKKKHGTNKGSLGEAHGRSKLTEFQVLEIRKRWSEGESQKDLAVEYETNISNVNKVLNRRSWKHI